MLNLKRIQKDSAEIIKLLKIKNFDAGEIIEQIINQNKKRR